MSGLSFNIRPYQPSDREALFKIAADTAFFGAPIEKYMEDRRIFLDAFYAYYTDYEPEHAWVAATDGKVVGFLTGAVNTRRQHQVSQQLTRQVWKRLITGGYHPGMLTFRYALRIWWGDLQGEMPSADLDIYPAHLHINIDAACRGFGLGRKLIETYLFQLRELGVPGVHLGTTSENEGACRLYEKMGFQLVAAHRSSLWHGIIDHPVENRIYARLVPDSAETL